VVNLIDTLLPPVSPAVLSETVGQFIAQRLADAGVWASPRHPRSE
jgi:hypothetical protein